MSHGRPWTTIEQRANAHGLLAHGHGSCTDGGALYCIIGERHRWTIGGQSWLYRLYYPLCVSRRIDTWQIVYLSYNEPCLTISIHKRYIHVPSVLSAVCIAQNWYLADILSRMENAPSQPPSQPIHIARLRTTMPGTPETNRATRPTMHAKHNR